MTTAAASVAEGAVRSESFPVDTDSLHVHVHVGADPVVVEMVDGLDHAQVDVAHNSTVEGDGFYERLLRTVRGAALGDATNSEEGLRSHLLSSAEISYSSYNRQLVVRSPQRGAVRFGTIAITVRVPSGSDLVVRGDVTDVETKGAAGAIQVKARRGEIRVDSASSVALRLRHGRVDVGTVRDHVTADMRAASLEVADLQGDADVTSSTGSVALTLRPGGPVDVALDTRGSVDTSDLPAVDDASPGAVRDDRPARQVSVTSGVGNIRLSGGGS